MITLNVDGTVCVAIELETALQLYSRSIKSIKQELAIKSKLKFDQIEIDFLSSRLERYEETFKAIEKTCE